LLFQGVSDPVQYGCFINGFLDKINAPSHNLYRNLNRTVSVISITSISGDMVFATLSNSAPSTFAFSDP